MCKTAQSTGKMGLLLQQPAELLGELWSFGSLEKQLLPTINKKKGIVAGGRNKVSPAKNRIFCGRAEESLGIDTKNLWEFTRINAEGKKK